VTRSSAGGPFDQTIQRFKSGEDVAGLKGMSEAFVHTQLRRGSLQATAAAEDDKETAEELFGDDESAKTARQDYSLNTALAASTSAAEPRPLFAPALREPVHERRRRAWRTAAGTRAGPHR